MSAADGRPIESHFDLPETFRAVLTAAAVRDVEFPPSLYALGAKHGRNFRAAVDEIVGHAYANRHSPYGTDVHAAVGRAADKFHAAEPAAPPAAPGRPACGSCARMTAAALDLAEWARAVRPALGATSRLEMEARVAAVHEAVVADAEPDPDAYAVRLEADEALRLDEEADLAEDRRDAFDADEPGLACPAVVPASDYCEVCETGDAEWSAPIGGGGGVRACSACVECHAADRMEPGVTWTRLDGRAKQTDGLVVLVNGAETARKEG